MRPWVQLGAAIATSNAVPTFGTFHQSTLINIGRIACSDFEDTYQCQRMYRHQSTLINIGGIACSDFEDTYQC